MNVAEQTEPNPDLPKGALALATIDDLLRELHTRCEALIVCMVVTDEDGEDQTLTTKYGSSMACLGMAYELLHRMSH